jgi:uncharacterized membrane protein YczE
MKSKSKIIKCAIAGSVIATGTSVSLTTLSSCTPDKTFEISDAKVAEWVIDVIKNIVDAGKNEIDTIKDKIEA